MSEPLSLGFRLVVKLVRRLFPNVPRMTTDQLNEIMRRTSSHGEAETPGENLVLLNGWEFVPNTNITSAHLNTKGLHLIKSGTQPKLFSKNISSNNDYIPSGPTARGFKMAFLNIVSIPKYIDEIRTSKLMNSFDILGFSETRLDDTYTDDELKIHGYDIFRKDRNRDGGGVCVYIRSSINCVNRKEIVPEDVEAVCLEIRKPNSRPFIVSVVYRPESPIEYFNRFEELIKAVDDEDKEHVILGDLNCCLLKKKVFDNKTKKLKSIYEAYQLSQLINEPTRITIDSKSLIDHFVTSSPDKINSSGVIHIGPSDHI
ncbi:predicted protein [Nematostella vectensis]|uniref:Endonuclease/exonuclease/phosphatase domain-containing protein n=1 Tax=Nematostella vectensis TaxID=45351 RepID=A7SKL1_NEMVE|nr:predicted protein [Nematostella vectensis]|eukprot:XP_001647513.1 predicted protein [Nematostella vectensis]